MSKANQAIKPIYNFGDKSKTLRPHKVVETPKGVYINGQKIDFVVEDSVSVKFDGNLALVTLTFVADSFEYQNEDIQDYYFEDQ